MRHIFTGGLLLLALTVGAQGPPVRYSPWTTTTSPGVARAALGAVGTNHNGNVIIDGAVRLGGGSATGLRAFSFGTGEASGYLSAAGGSYAYATNDQSMVLNLNGNPGHTQGSDSNGTFTVNATASRFFGGPVYATSIVVSNALTLFTGTNAVTLTAGPSGVTSDADIEFRTLTSATNNTRYLSVTNAANFLGSVTFGGQSRTNWPEAGTNSVTGIVSSPEVIRLATNNVVISGTNYLVFGLFSNFTRAEITQPYTNSYTAGTIPPLPDFRLVISTNGTDWTEAAATTNPVYVALYDVNTGGSTLGFATAITVWGYSDVTTVGRVLDLFGQDIRSDGATNARSIVNLTQAQALAQAAANAVAYDWSRYGAVARPALVGRGLLLSDKWAVQHTQGSNESSVALGPYGEALLTLTANDVVTPANVGKLRILSFVSSGGTDTLTVSASNVVSAMVPQSNTNLFYTNWVDVAGYTSSYPNATNNAYTLTWPTGTNLFYRLRSVTNGTYTATRRLTVSGTLAATNGIIHPSLSAAPTIEQIGATNVWFTWASNGSPPLLVTSYYNAASNIVSKTLAP